ncbi:MAG: DEAD/DEAH box helicase family protein [Candidatus Omnitrophica bacterium]|nr:DEAD/DEAH box helicase family protein [Candidatus Omnitrophota bacterium]
MSIYNEKAFEELIEQSLLVDGGYVKGDPTNFNRDLAIDTSVLLQFIKETQKDVWEELESIHNAEIEKKFLYRLNQELDVRGMLDCLRNGIIDYGKKFKLAYFKPVSGLNPETQSLYEKNILTVTRQVHYSSKDESSVDMVLSLNGLPVATMELKNPFTGQNADNAKQQYKYDRDAQELLFQFKKRALVHFAVDTDVVYMTTRLQGSKTSYLPFNKGVNKGAGNPVVDGKHKTHYLWEEVFEKTSWMDIFARFVHLQSEEYLIEGKKVRKEKMIFPRYHQLDSVRKITKDALVNGTGKNYLIQHSAGSGKSNSIAWLAYRLAGIHDGSDNRIFNSVIVITDRLVLDQQLQDTIYQFEHKRGVVEKIDKDSQQLADALTSGTNIIITTLQKFPFVLDKVKELPKSNYAVIVDEAHSSQGGEMAGDLKKVLMIRDEDDVEDGLREMMRARGPQSNVSFFAFTATPKAKTIETFGRKGKDGKPEPFHLYSMRQAIEEGFILDVLQNYISYKTYFQLSKKIEDDPNVNKKKAAIAIARFLTLHPHNLAQKTEVIVEHFRQVTMKKIGGKAKAMVVTASREHVVRYKQEFDQYLKEKGYKDIKALVAFSGKVLLDGIPPEYTEEGMNVYIDANGKAKHIKEKELPEKFSTSEYQLLLVAEKYQTGFDQPLLHTMYVDKRLDGVKAVQALSRLNRTHSGKDDTFILDFVNNREDILNAFQPYYEETSLIDVTDPNKLYDLKNKIKTFKVIDYSDVDAFCDIFFKDKKLHNRTEHAYLNALVDKAVERYEKIEKDEYKEDFANTCRVFVRLYAFLAQIMPFSDVELEKFYAYTRFLLKKLPKRTNEGRFTLDDEVALEYYRLQKVAEGKIELQKGANIGLKPVTEAGTKKDKEEFAQLSEIVKILNDRFGTDFTEADKLFFDQIEEELVLNEKLGTQAKSNTIENFKFGFEDVFRDKLIDRMEQNQDIFNKIMDDKAFSSVVKDYLIKKVYKRLNAQEEGSAVKIDEDQETLFLSDIVSDEDLGNEEKYTEYLPVYSVAAIATSFGEEQPVDLLGWKPVKLGKKPQEDMFIAKVVGKSMEPTIKDGSYCIFRFDKGGSRNGLVVIVASSLVSDSETQQRFTIKRYHSEKEYFDEGTWKHKKITLSPDNKEFKDIVLEDVNSEDFKVIAELVEVLDVN